MHHLSASSEISQQCYDAEKQTEIIIVYVIAIILWIVLIIFLGLHKVTAWPVLIIPFVVFGIAVYNVGNLCEEVEVNMTKASYLSIGMILMLPLFNWLIKESPKYQEVLTNCMIVSVSLSLLTFIDIWLPAEKMSIFYHMRSALQAMSVSLLLFSLVTYNFHHGSNVL
jgi:hypothetical protein